MLQSEKHRAQQVLFYLVLLVPFMMFTSYALDTLPVINEPSLKMLAQAIVLSIIIHGWLRFVLETGNFKGYLEVDGIKKLGIGALFGALVALIVVVLDNLVGTKSRVFNPALLSSAFFRVLVSSIIFFISESYIEEMVTRGYVLEQFEEMHHPHRAVIYSSLVFVLVKFLWDRPHVNLLGWANFYVLAFFLGLLYLCTKAKWLCIGFHTAWNLVFTTLFPVTEVHSTHFASYVHMESWLTFVLLLLLAGVSLYRFEKHHAKPEKKRGLEIVGSRAK